jgi:hypothetical protein
VDKFFKLGDPSECARSLRVPLPGWGSVAEELCVGSLLGCGCFGGRLEAKFGENSPFSVLSILRLSTLLGFRIIGGLVAFITVVREIVAV